MQNRISTLSGIALSTLILSSSLFVPNAVAAATGLYDRSAHGDVTQFGGARRLTGIKLKLCVTRYLIRR